MEKLEQEQRERDEARRELEQLEKDMQRAAEELRNQLEKMTPEQRKALEQLQKDLSRMQDEIKKLQKQKQGRGQAQMMLGSLKTVLRRMARSSMGPGSGGQQGGQGQGQGQSGSVREFLQRASGKGGQGEEVLVEGEGGKDGPKVLTLGQGGDQTVILPGLGGQGSGQGGKGQQQGQNGPGGGKGGDGAGTQHDPNLQGDPTQISGNRKLTKVTGKEGAGPTRSETILGAAEKGFATSAYRRVYGDYTAVSEQVMSKQRVPPGYRFYVKRYFQMIKPRDR
jgi:chaperonin cofactor prefoldin